MRKELIKHEIPLVTKQLSQSGISWTHHILEYFLVSLHLEMLKSAQDNTLFQQSLEKIIGLFATLSFQDHN